MPNHIHNAFVLSAADAADVLAALPDGMDFEVLVPSPPNCYMGNLSAADSGDFPVTWGTWCPANWGTKWNAYDCITLTEGDDVILRFQTAWNPPRPVAVAFARRFGVPFRHFHACEGMGEGWGVETWGAREQPFGDGKTIVRTAKAENDPGARDDVMRFTGCSDWTGAQDGDEA